MQVASLRAKVHARDLRTAFEEWREVASGAASQRRQLHLVVGRMRASTVARAFLSWHSFMQYRRNLRLAVLTMQRRSLAAAFRTWRLHRVTRLQAVAAMLGQHSLITGCASLGHLGPFIDPVEQPEGTCMAASVVKKSYSQQPFCEQLLRWCACMCRLCRRADTSLPVQCKLALSGNWQLSH